MRCFAHMPRTLCNFNVHNIIQRVLSSGPCKMQEACCFRQCIADHTCNGRQSFMVDQAIEGCRSAGCDVTCQCRPTHRHASGRALPAALPSSELHDSKVVVQASPCTQTGLHAALFLVGILEGANRVGVLVNLQ